MLLFGRGIFCRIRGYSVRSISSFGLLATLFPMIFSLISATADLPEAFGVVVVVFNDFLNFFVLVADMVVVVIRCFCQEN